jgi:hypothetical protein
MFFTKTAMHVNLIEKGEVSKLVEFLKIDDVNKEISLNCLGK